MPRSSIDERWEARAKAELGQILYMGGDVQSATAMLREAIVSQYVRLDIGAAVYYTAMVGNGFVEAGRPETALEYCNTALKAAYFTLVHLDNPSPEVIRQRRREFDPATYFCADCPLCGLMKESGIIVFDDSVFDGEDA